MAYQPLGTGLPQQGYGTAAAQGYYVPTAPATQAMTDYIGLLQGSNGLLVRQRLRLKNLCVCTLKNEYDLGNFPMNMNPQEAWPDSVFKQSRGLMYASEQSECCDKVCCGRYRAFTMHTYYGSDAGQEVLTYSRPFKCPLICCCVMPWPQEIHTVNTKTGQKLGSVTQDWRCAAALCGRYYWRVADATGATSHVIEQNVCCNANCFAPNCCCEIHKFDIYDPGESQVIGSIENIWPGCSLRTLCCRRLIDNYRLTFPTNASPEHKANLIGALILIDYMMFSNTDDQNQGVAAQ